MNLLPCCLHVPGGTLDTLVGEAVVKARHSFMYSVQPNEFLI